MSGLVLSLKADEKFLVNGALLINGSKRSQIRIGDDDVNVLRISDALHPSEVTTPVRRVYYAAQIFLSGDAKASEITYEVLEGLSALETVFEDTPMLTQIKKAKNAAASGRFYSLICCLRPLLALEAEILNVELPSVCKDYNERSIVSTRSVSTYSAAAATKGDSPLMPSKTVKAHSTPRSPSGRPILSLMEKTG